MNMRRRQGRARWWAAAMVWAAGAVAATGLFATPAYADPARARAHFDLGKRYFEVDEYAKAIEEFKAAHVEEPDPAFLYNIAECYRHMGESKEALVFYRRFLLLSPPNAPARPSVEKRIAALQAAMTGAAEVPPAPAAAPAASATPEARPSAPAPAAPPVTLAMAAPPAAAAPAPVDLRDQASPAPPTVGSRPFYTRPWFYVVVGGALVAGTIGAFALASGKSGGPPSTPLGNQPAFR